LNSFISNYSSVELLLLIIQPFYRQSYGISSRIPVPCSLAWLPPSKRNIFLTKHHSPPPSPRIVWSIQRRRTCRIVLILVPRSLRLSRPSASIDAPPRDSRDSNDDSCALKLRSSRSPIVPRRGDRSSAEVRGRLKLPRPFRPARTFAARFELTRTEFAPASPPDRRGSDFLDPPRRAPAAALAGPALQSLSLPSTGPHSRPSPSPANLRDGR